MAKVTGIDRVLQNLAREVDAIEGATEAGVIKAAMFIRRRSQKLTPIRLGNLRNSAYVIGAGLNDPPEAAGGGFKGDPAAAMEIQHKEKKLKSKGQVQALARNGPAAAVGYSAEYALEVHENPKAGAAGNTLSADLARQPKSGVPLSSIHSKQGQWKFLEQPLKEHGARVLGIIKREAKF